MADSQESMSSPAEGAGLASPQQMQQLIADHHQRLYRYAFRLTGSAADAEDITQQTYLIAQQRLDQLRDEAKAGAWLTAILRTTFLKSVRRQRPVDASSMELDVTEIPSQAAEDPVDQELLQSALSSLSDDYRLVLLMFYFEQASYREIAERLELPIGTVMSRLSRAKSRLRAALLTRDVDLPSHPPQVAKVEADG